MGEDSPHSLLSVKAMTHYITSLLGRSLTMVLYDTTMFNLIKIDIIYIEKGRRYIQEHGISCHVLNDRYVRYLFEIFEAPWSIIN